MFEANDIIEQRLKSSLPCFSEDFINHNEKGGWLSIAMFIGVTFLIYETDQASSYLLMKGVLFDAFEKHLMKVKSNGKPKLLGKIKWDYVMS